MQPKGLGSGLSHRKGARWVCGQRKSPTPSQQSGKASWRREHGTQICLREGREVVLGKVPAEGEMGERWASGVPAVALNPLRGAGGWWKVCCPAPMPRWCPDLHWRDLGPLSVLPWSVLRKSHGSQTPRPVCVGSRRAEDTSPLEVSTAVAISALGQMLPLPGLLLPPTGATDTCVIGERRGVPWVPLTPARGHTPGSLASFVIEATGRI